MTKGVFTSKIYNKKILLIQPGVGLSTSNFTGLAFDETTQFTEVFNTDNFQVLKEKNFDYIFVHGFLFRDFEQSYNIELIKNLNIICNQLIIDYSGEGYSLLHDMNSILKNSKIFNYNKIKIISPLDNTSILEKKYPEILFFNKTKIAGLRFFCSPFNHMLHNNYFVNQDSERHVYSGLNWNDEKKENLFMCLNNREAVHRAMLVNEILNESFNVNYLLSCNFEENFEQVYNFFDKEKNELILGIKIKLNKITLEHDNLLERFSPNIHLAKKCYIDVITETYPGKLMFITEKTAKPFFNLQFPIIFGPPGIIQKLREYGFDVFDDIINHEYDNYTLDFNQDSDYYYERLNLFVYNKTKKIIEELKRLSTFDFYQIYIKSKDRLLYNQELINKICIDDNNILFDMGDYIFGDSIVYCYEPTFQKHTY